MGGAPASARHFTYPLTITDLGYNYFQVFTHTPLLDQKKHVIAFNNWDRKNKTVDASGESVLLYLNTHIAVIIGRTLTESGGRPQQ